MRLAIDKIHRRIEEVENSILSKQEVYKRIFPGLNYGAARRKAYYYKHKAKRANKELIKLISKHCQYSEKEIYSLFSC